MTLSAAMEEDDFLIQAAGWARYYEKAQEVVGQIVSAQIAESPAKEVIDNPQAFQNWVDYCKEIQKSQKSY